MAPAPEHPTPLGALGLVLLRFYEWRDSLRSPLTPLDREVLASTYGRRGTKAQLADMIHAHVGVTYDPTVLWVHECLLLVGAPSRVVPEPLNAGQHRQAEPDPAEPTGHRATGGSYILLIEAEREVREEIGGALREAGYRVIPARNGARALLSALQELPSLVLIDVRPPYN